MVEALKREGCTLRDESTLCHNFMDHGTFNPKFDSPEKIAMRMAQMRLLSTLWYKEFLEAWNTCGNPDEAETIVLREKGGWPAVWPWMRPWRAGAKTFLPRESAADSLFPFHSYPPPPAAYASPASPASPGGDGVHRFCRSNIPTTDTWIECIDELRDIMSIKDVGEHLVSDPLPRDGVKPVCLVCELYVCVCL